MPPQQREEVADHEATGQGMRRVASESDMSDSGSPSKEYRVRKSTLIGYVVFLLYLVSHVIYSRKPLKDLSFFTLNFVFVYITSFTV
jgi:hypothetical protein